MRDMEATPGHSRGIFQIIFGAIPFIILKQGSIDPYHFPFAIFYFPFLFLLILKNDF
jgi:hypothetical protein